MWEKPEGTYGERRGETKEKKVEGREPTNKEAKEGKGNQRTKEE